MSPPLYFTYLRDNAETIWNAILHYAKYQGDRLMVKAQPCQFDHPDGTATQWQWEPPLEWQAFLLAEEHFGATTYYTFSLEEPVQDYLFSVPRIENWGPVPDHPDDPAIFQGETLILWTISHEAYVWIRLPDFQKQQLEAMGAVFEAVGEEKVPMITRRGGPDSPVRVGRF